MSSPIQKTPYLRNERNFPVDSQALSVELSRSYTDVASNVNSRTIGIFPEGSPAVNGEAWYYSGGNEKQQALRQIYPFTSANLTIPHGIIVSQISGFSRIWGTFVDAGGVWYPLPFVSAVAVANQVQVSVNATNIVIVVGGGAPVPVRGTVILEWLAVKLPN